MTFETISMDPATSNPANEKSFKTAYFGLSLHFLTDRRMILTHNQEVSEEKSMPGGGPAGTTLGLIMFVLLINDTANPGQKTKWGKILISPLLVSTLRSPNIDKKI